MDTIVVGVDGSEESLDALRFATEEAELREARLEIVTAWEVPSTAYGFLAPSATDLRDQLRTGAEEVLREAVDLVREEWPAVEVDGLAVEGNAAAAVLDRARDAVLVVVGSRGRGGFERLLLGSVSTHVVHHATCPVVVVPRRKR